MNPLLIKINLNPITYKTSSGYETRFCEIYPILKTQIRIGHHLVLRQCPAVRDHLLSKTYLTRKGSKSPVDGRSRSLVATNEQTLTLDPSKCSATFVKDRNNKI